ncbi:MAG: ABC transporter permease, partial [Lewinella sp.]|uniref:ABC transporter permease n=1 Tax=Lewinella sp. TaxID=2004506 RepID=UPI003D6B75FD
MKTITYTLTPLHVYTFPQKTHPDMLQIILKSAWRQLWKNKGYSTINIMGLSVGLTVAILSGLWVQHHWQYDRIYTDSELIYRGMQEYTPKDGEASVFSALCLPLVQVLREETPGIAYAAATDWGANYSLVRGEQRLLRAGIYAEQDFLHIFSFSLLKGDVATALAAPNQIVISESVAETLFGEEDPLGQTISLDNTVSLQVTGVIQDIPEQSSIAFDFLLPFSLKEQREPWVAEAKESWDNNSFQIYFKLKPTADIAKIEAQHREVLTAHSSNNTSLFTVHALQDWHLYGEFVDGKATTGLIRYVKLFGIIGLLVLLIACINFVNISTARAEKRSKEVGVRKAIGARRTGLMAQFLGEAAFTVMLAFALSLILVQLLLPYFSLLVSESISLPWRSPVFWGVVLAVLSFSTLLAGSYPAFFLTRYQAKEVLQKTYQVSRGRNSWSRRMLVGTQFAVSIALIAGSLVVHQQVEYAQERDKGYNQERLVSVMNTPGINENFATIKRELLASNMVENVTGSGSPITSVWSNMSNISWPGKAVDDNLGVAFVATGPDYFETIDLQLIEGRPFRDYAGADTSAFVLNEAAVKRMGLEDPLSTQIIWDEAPFQVVGVVKDVIMETPFEPVRPTIFVNMPEWFSVVFIRLRPDQPTEQALASLKNIFEAHDPATPFNYEFVEEEYSNKFSGTNFIGTVALLFAGLAIFLSALGLLGLAVYLAERRAKEISIRKILGASVSQLWLLLSQEFVWIILVGGLIAVPLGSYFLEGWLDNFTYRIDLPWMMFGLAAGIALLIALVTI